MKFDILKCHNCGHSVGTYSGGYVWGRPYCGTHLPAEMGNVETLEPGTRVAVALRQNGIMPLPPYPAAKMGEQKIMQNFCAAGEPNAMGQTK